jgi:hypothetical protein
VFRAPLTDEHERTNGKDRPMNAITYTTPAYEPTDENLLAHLTLAHGLTETQARDLLARSANEVEELRDNRDDTSCVAASILETDRADGIEVPVIPTPED